jgi:hypothetical protein
LSRPPVNQFCGSLSAACNRAASRLPGAFAAVAAKVGLDIDASAAQAHIKAAQRKPARANCGYLNNADSPLYERVKA